MKLLPIPAMLLLLAGSAPREETIAFAPEEGTTLERTFQAHAEYTIEFGMRIDGEDLEPSEQPDYTSEWTETIAVTDEILGVEDGRPTDLKRTFDDLSQESTDTVGDDEVERSLSSDLEGETVRFTWDDDDEEYHVELVDEDSDLDPDVLQWLSEDMDLLGVLPDDEVEVGDSWEIDESVYLPLMWPSGLVGFHAEDEDAPDADDNERNQQTIDNLEAEGTATFEEVREDEDGRRLAVLSIELSITTSTSRTREDEGPEGESVEVTVDEEIERELEGEILWDLDAGHLHSVSLEGDSTWVQTESADVDTPDGTRNVARVITMDGTISYSVEID